MPHVRICVCHPNKQHCQQIIEAFRQQDAELELVALVDVRQAVVPAQQDKPGLLLVVGVDAPGDPALRVIASLQDEKGAAPGIIVVSQRPSQELLVACMRAGADEFLEFPIQTTELVEALDRLYRKKGIIQQAAGKTTAVYSAKGGTGTTTIASNLALNVARLVSGDNPCCLMDVNRQFGNVALLLDIREFSHSLADACRDVERLDAALLNSYVSRHQSGAAALPAPQSLEEMGEVEPASLAGVIRKCQELFAHVILDLSHDLDGLTLAGLDSADQVLILCDMMVPTIHNTKLAVDMFKELDSGKAKLRLIVNRYYESSRISLQQISDHVQLPIYWVVPYDSPVAITAVNTGHSFDQVDGDSEVAKSLLALAQDLAGVEGEARPKKKFSLFGRR
jgi:pilus assembly protein CpaE